MGIANLRTIKKLYFGYREIARALGISLASGRVAASRYVRRGFLVRIKRNIYVLREAWDNLSQEELFGIANIAQVPSYVSLLSALSYYEITTQVQRRFVESVALKRTKELEIDNTELTFTKIKKKLYFGFIKKEGFFIAAPEKALLDVFYLLSLKRYSVDLSSINREKLDLAKLDKLAGLFPEKTRNLLKGYGYLKRHEIFEIEALETFKSCKLLENLVFGGGTMLRLCYGLGRYSTDLDFWFIKKTATRPYFQKAKKCLQKSFELTDAQIKFYTILFELRSPRYPKRLKIEIRKSGGKGDFQETIAFSKYDTRQVFLNAFSLEEALKRKIEAALDRKDIRDFFDIEFLLRKGLALNLSGNKKTELKKIIAGFRAKDYKVTLGSVLAPEIRKFYIANEFAYLLQKI